VWGPAKVRPLRFVRLENYKSSRKTESADIKIGLTIFGQPKSIRGDPSEAHGARAGAGKKLQFAITIAALRLATDEELDHGHVHEAGHAHE
jgi:hypothetical protein